MEQIITQRALCPSISVPIKSIWSTISINENEICNVMRCVKIILLKLSLRRFSNWELILCPGSSSIIRCTIVYIKVIQKISSCKIHNIVYQIFGKNTSTCFMKMKLLLTKSWFFYIWIFSKTDSFLMATVFKTSLWIYQMFFNIIRIHAVSVPWLNLRGEFSGENLVRRFTPRWKAFGFLPPRQCYLT